MLNDLPSVAQPAPARGRSVVNASVKRRDLLKLTASVGGILLAGTLPAPTGAEERSGDETEGDGAQPLNIWVAIAPDERVTIIAHRSEMGQGIRTGLPQVLADELQADWENISVQQALGDARYGSQNTDGSRSIRKFYPIMREMGATARTLLEQAAANTWGVDTDQVRAQNHKVTHLATGRTLSFGTLAGKASKLEPPNTDSLKLKSPQTFNYIGRDLAPVDLDDMIVGRATFGIDTQLPDMVHASIERCPVIGGRLQQLDDKAAQKMKGVIDVITLPENTFPIGFSPLHGVAVIADNTWVAQQARTKLKCEWAGGDNAAHSSAEALEMLRQRVQTPGKTRNQWGDFDLAVANSADTHEAIYTAPYLAHAPMEPPAAVARVDGEHCEIWSCTQAPQGVQEHVAKALGIDKSQVTVHVTLLGGAFGRKAKADFSVEAAILAKQVGRPVKVTWTREDDVRFGYYHAISAQYFKATIDRNQSVSGWLQRTAFPSIMSIFSAVDAAPAGWELDLGFSELPVEVANFQSEYHAVKAQVRIGWLRSVCNVYHAFARCSFIDELAHKLGQAPPMFWLDMIGPDEPFRPQERGYEYGNYGEPVEQFPMDRKRLKNVVKIASRFGNWSQMPEGEGWGLAAHRSFVSYVAVASHVKVHNDRLHVEKVHIVIDCGLAVNPDRIKSQMEGSVIFGLSIALMGEIAVQEGQVQQSNFDDYPVLRLEQCPTIEVHIVDSDEPPAGVGEPGVPPIAPSITNALFAATGRRIRDLPLNRVFDLG